MRFYLVGKKSRRNMRRLYLQEPGWKYLINRERRAINSFTNGLKPNGTDVDSLLSHSNRIALEYLDDFGVGKSLWEFMKIGPNCFEHTMYTYAVFLNLTEGYQEKRDNVYFVMGAGVYSVNGRIRGNGHGFLGIKRGKEDKLEVYETIPDNRGYIQGYDIWAYLNISKEGKLKVFENQLFCGLLSANVLFGGFKF
jgi:hypothetical protein